jgi:hypothetical protein
MIRYQSRRGPDTALRAQIRVLANERKRFGYRRLFFCFGRAASRLGSTHLPALSRGKTCGGKRRAVGTRAPILVEAKANAR